MLGLGANMMKHPITGKSIVRDSLVLQHNYNVSPVQLISSGTAFFDGTNDYINIGDIGAIKSLAFWFNPSISISSSTSYQRMFAFNSSYHGVSLGASTGSISGEVIAVLPDAVSRTGATTPLTANTWYHGCISWNASNNNFDIYIDGVLSNNLTAGTHTLTNWDSFIIGTDNGVGTHFGGLICNVGVWSETLSQPQVKSIMQKDYAGLSDSEKTDLVSWWNLDSVIPGSTTLVYDNHYGGGETLGVELITDGNFLNGLDSWSVSGTDSTHYVEFPGVGARFVSDTTSPVLQLIQNVVTSGNLYKLTCNVAYTSGETLRANIGGINLPALTEGENTHYATAGSTAFHFLRNTSNVDALITNVSLKQVNGNTGTLS